MKKNLFISSALAFMALTSCQQEKLGGNTTELDGFRVRTEEMTKAVLDGVKVVFEDNDAIDIYPDDEETPSVYAYNQANDIFVATGTEAEGAEYTAIFPSRETPSRTSIYISNRQVATVNSFPKNSMYMAGVSNSNEMTLRHLTGLWEIDLLPQYDGQKLVRASLTMNGGQKINGNFEVDFTDNSLTYIDGGNSSILLAEIAYVMTAGEPVKLYFALPEGKYEGGFTFTATMTDGTTMEVTSPSTINIARGQITKVKNDVAYRLFASGTGTETDPYVIKGANHWNNMVRKVNTDATNYARAYYKVESDIDFENEAVTPIKNFEGVLDGSGYTLSNAKIGNGTASHQAFFYLLNGTVKNLNFDKITVTGGNATGAASSAAVISAGNSSLDFTIENCHVSNSTIVSGPEEGANGGSYAAGLVGRCNNENVIIKNCSVTNSTIKATCANAAGVVGYLGNGKLDGVLSRNNNISVETANIVGGVVGGMGGGSLINIVSKNNVCSVKTVSCGGIVGVCTSNDAKIINVLSDGNTVKSNKNAALLYLGLIMGTNGTAYTTSLANSLVLTGTAEYVFTPSETYNFAGGIGIALGYGSATVESGYYFQNYRTRFDLAYSVDAVAAGYNSKGYRFAIGVKQNTGTAESKGGTDGNFTVSKEAALTDGTVLAALNAWVDANKKTYPTLKSWTARTSGKTFPEIVLADTATPSAEPLNVVESQY